MEINKPFYKEDKKIIYNLEQLELIVRSHKNENLILTSGCFDIIHIGHIHNLKQAKLLGDKLFVCLSNDNQIKKLKGTNRPINNYNDRIELFKTIQYVDYIILYDEEDIENDLDEKIETLMASKRIVREVQASTLASGVVVTGPSRTAIDKLELAKRLASKINLKQGPGGPSVLPETSIGAISVITYLSILLFVCVINSFYRQETLRNNWPPN